MPSAAGTSIYRGILTGYNAAFLVDDATQQALVDEDPRSADLLKPILRGRDIRPYRAQWAGLWLIATFPSVGVQIDEYPAIKRHLLNHGKARLEQSGKALTGGLRARKRTPHRWYELQDTCAYHAEFGCEKLFWMDISPEARFAHSESEVYCNNTVYLMTGSYLKYLAVILNSRLTSWYVSRIARTTGLGLPRWESFTVEQVRIPHVSDETRATFELAFDHAVSQSFDLDAVRQEQSQLVNSLYGLSRSEVKTLEDGA